MSKDPGQSGANGEPRPKGTITTDGDGNEHFEGTFDEQMALANGGRYDWVDSEGNNHWTIVTPEGTIRGYETTDGAGGGDVHQEFTPHERREGTPGTDAGDIGIVDRVLAGVMPFIPGVGYYGAGYYDPGYYGAGYFDPGYYDPGYVAPASAGYVVPADAGYVAPTYEPELVPGTSAGAADQGIMRFTRRLLYIANNTNEPITVHVQFRALNERGEWVWLPTDPAASEEALTFQLAAGQEGYFEHHGVPISASRVRIWAQSDSQQWIRYQNEDLWLVSEVDASGERAYFATEMETFPFRFE